MRAYRQRVALTGIEGINEQHELATPNQLADCRNVWAQNGSIESRPGYQPVTRSYVPDLFTANADDWDFFLGDGADPESFTSPSGGVLTLDNAAVGERLYLGKSAIFTIFGLGFVNPKSNDNNSIFKAQYYNGTDWMYIPIEEYISDGSPLTYAPKGNFLGSSTITNQSTAFKFAEPKDWATTTVNGTTAYWIRFEILDEALDSEVEIDQSPKTSYTGGGVVGLMVAQYSSTKHYVIVDVVRGASATAAQTIYNIDSLRRHNQSFPIQRDDNNIYEPPTMAVVPQFEESYVAFGKRCTKVKARDFSPEVAKVESDPSIVGPNNVNAPYNRDSIAQLTAWPDCNYTEFFKGHIWCAGIENEPYTVRWSAPVPYHTVWPALNFEYIMENDNSPITGIHPLGEHMVVFKQDSIWVMLDTGINAFGLQTYTPRQVVAGVGCVANSSIQEVRGNLVFLGEDGLYVFNGQKAEKATLDKRMYYNPELWADRLEATFRSITKGRRQFVSSVNWKNEQCYLLSMTTDGSSTNNLTVCWNYDKNTFWLWDNIDAQHWMVDEEANDEEALYFGDSSGNIYRFGLGKTDAGQAISSYVSSKYFGLEDSYTRRVLDVIVTSSNRCSGVTVDLLKNDDVSNATVTIPMTDENEAQYGSGTYGTSTYVTPRRRRRRAERRDDCQWYQVKISHSTKNERFELDQVQIGAKLLGVR